MQRLLVFRATKKKKIGNLVKWTNAVWLATKTFIKTISRKNLSLKGNVKAATALLTGVKLHSIIKLPAFSYKVNMQKKHAGIVISKRKMVI